MPMRANRTLSIILGGGRGTRLFPLTTLRAKPAVPLGGKYRLIDVPISNCLNSGLNRIYVLTQFQSVSLHRHVQGTYRFDRFGAGFIDILAAQQTIERDAWYQGTADAVRQNLTHFGEDWDEALILSGDQLYQMDFHHLLAHHRRTGAEITIAAIPVAAEACPALGILQVNPEGRIIAFFEKPAATALAGLETDANLFAKFRIDAGPRRYLASMGIYVFSRQVLRQELLEHDYVDFGKHLFPANIKKRRVQAYIWDGYWADIGDVGSFHEANLAMARIPPAFSFQSDYGMIYTRPRTLPGAVVGSLQATRAIVADGCRIGQAVLEDSILGIRSIVGTGVRLRRTLVMGADFYETDHQRAENRNFGRPDIGIGSNVVIENAIVDKNVRIGSDVVIKDPTRIRPQQGPFHAVRDGVVCILKGAIVPSGTRLGLQNDE